ncbi:hypothetical protein CNX65_04805 [Actinosynnema pretiosum]|uniref:Uncharacterized protein n=1 Tax=Actinosynnema pretiosum TaxID=42197 RepID=A0A290Z110_9PSEU|nr:hypothetical protein CNX65_04805 [Actinosynnema pretiosum]
MTCTERKTAQPSPQLRARSLPAGTTDHRVAAWCERLGDEPRVFPLESLYQGEHWVLTRALVVAARKAGFSPELWVASAGLGLQRASQSAPSYAATFSPRHEDTVADEPEERARWWNGVQRRRGGATLAELGERGAVLLVLSEAYGTALHGELRELGELFVDALMIGGSSDVRGVRRVRSDGGLRKALGGTMTGLNTRMAISWLEHCTSGKLTSTDAVMSWERWSRSASQPERYDREPLTDAQVKDFIRETAATHPGYSRTRLHRMLRDSGKACEQKRFAVLHAETVEER